MIGFKRPLLLQDAKVNLNNSCGSIVKIENAVYNDKKGRLFGSTNSTQSKAAA